MQIENYERENAFGESELRLLTTIAASLGTALENARLFDETQQRNAELAIINAVQGALAAELDIQGIYDAVGEKLREIFDAQTVSIYSANLKTRIMSVEYSFEKGQKYEPMNTPFNSMYDYFVGLEKILVMNNDFPQFAATFKDYKVPQGEIPRSIMATPVYRNKAADFWVGVSIQDMDGEKTFVESDARLLETLANAMSVALQNARLFDETQQRNAELAIINSVQEGLASKLEIQAIYDLVGDKLREIFKADTTFIAFHDKKKENVIIPYYADKDAKKPFTRPYGHGLYEHIVKTGKPLLTRNDKESAEIGNYLVASPGSKKDLNESFLGVPIFKDGKAIGAASVQSYKKNAYGESDLRLLATLANSMSVALESARLFDETQRLLKETEERAAELAFINSVQQGCCVQTGYAFHL